MIKLLALFMIFLCCATSCTPKLRIKLNAQDEVFVDMDVTHTDSTKRLIKSLVGFSGDSMFEGKETNIENVKGEDGFEIIKLKKSATLDVSAKLKFADSTKLESSLLFVNKSEKKLLFSLNRKTLASLFEHMTPEDKEYLDLLMAPSLQNTKMSEDEYIALISNAYGNKASQELKQSSLTLFFELPKKIKNVHITPKSEHKFNADKLEVYIPMTTVLVLEQDINIVVDYSN